MGYDEQRSEVSPFDTHSYYYLRLQFFIHQEIKKTAPGEPQHRLLEYFIRNVCYFAGAGASGAFGAAAASGAFGAAAGALGVVFSKPGLSAGGLGASTGFSQAVMPQASNPMKRRRFVFIDCKLVNYSTFCKHFIVLWRNCYSISQVLGLFTEITN